MSKSEEWQRHCNCRNHGKYISPDKSVCNNNKSKKLIKLKQISEEVQRAQWLKHCDYNNQDKDISPNKSVSNNEKS